MKNVKALKFSKKIKILNAIHYPDCVSSSLKRRESRICKRCEKSVDECCYNYLYLWWTRMPNGEYEIKVVTEDKSIESIHSFTLLGNIGPLYFFYVLKNIPDSSALLGDVFIISCANIDIEKNKIIMDFNMMTPAHWLTDGYKLQTIWQDRHRLITKSMMTWNPAPIVLKKGKREYYMKIEKQ